MCAVHVWSNAAVGAQNSGQVARLYPGQLEQFGVVDVVEIRVECDFRLSGSRLGVIRARGAQDDQGNDQR